MASNTYYAYANGGSQTDYRGKVVLTEHNDVANNRSTIDYVFYLYRADGFTGPAHSFTNGNKLVVVIDGVTLINSSNYKAVVLTGTSEAKPLTMCSGSVTVAHSNDGKKSFSFSFSYDQTQNHGQELDYLTVSGTHTCTSIARASAPTVSPARVEFGKAVTINTNRASNTFTHTLKYKLGSVSGTIAAGVGASASWTVPLSLMSQIPNAASGSIQITCETYSGSTLVGSSQVSLTATVPASVVPSVSVTVAEAASIPSGITGYIQGRSRLKVTSTGTGQYGATIKSYAVTMEGTGYSGAAVTTNVINGSGTVTVSVTVTDSRGRTAKKDTSITVTAYTPPRISGISAYRCKSATDGTADSSGAYICVKPSGGITSLSNKNAKTCTVYYKKTSASSYSSKALTMGDNTLDSESVIVPADVGSGYDIYVVLQDSFSQIRADAASVMAGAAYIHIPSGRNGIGFGKRTEGGMDVAWPVTLRDKLTAQSDVTLQKGFNVHAYRVNSGTAGYICVARITVTNTYANIPIVFCVSRRGDRTPTMLTVRFSNVDSTDPGLAEFLYHPLSVGAVMTKAAAGTWDLYVQKSESYDDMTLLDVKVSLAYGKVSITYPGTFSASKPSGTEPKPIDIPGNQDLTLSGSARHIQYASGKRTGQAISMYAGDEYGSGLVIGDGGRTIIGGGEAAQNLRTALGTTPGNETVEEMHIANDNAVQIHTSCQDITKRKTFTFEADGSLDIPGDIHTKKAVETYGLELLHASTPYFDFHFGGSTSDYTARIIEASKGALVAYNSISNGSDERLKKEVEALPERMAELVERLSPKTYRFRGGDTYLNAGLIAQEVLEAEKELGVTESVLVRGTGGSIPDPKDPEKEIIDYYSLDYNALTTLLLRYTVSKIHYLEERLTELETKIKTLDAAAKTETEVS